MSRFEEFRALHRPGRPLVLPNAWDHASAAALVAAGFAALGTTSLGVAGAAGLPDAAGAAREETLRLAGSLARLPVPVTVDIENGFGTDPEDVAALAALLERAGIAGVNIEDGRPDGTLTDVSHQCAVLRAVLRAAPSLFVNARTDTYWLPGHERETEDRLRAYQEAGAHGLFVPGLREEQAVRAVTGACAAPLNLLFTPGGPSVSELAAWGVARVSTGSLLFRAAVHQAVEVARGVLDDTPLAADLGGVPSYGRAQAWSKPFTGTRAGAGPIGGSPPGR
ncbi:isocitrate lyase/PEP mutase family protein [Streptomyces sp. WMMC1477]|uniref:isocitrate lyase/PEP mutase family protein n=1 Tax=Streptomyces sp. WMMC1477 TaxID=3015155 RepID=UPI0022B66867|nr:isocitrate lyase/phosphoenolpyruvate mutase family protein [Streptomyces sp. WMMC1477]MCZ7433012.1 isocitrate lyase/phosphoenolpyruvate mutase family protein [Streptomyces sp. WMMC1477]